MSKILVGLSGSIAAYKTCDLISQLKKRGHDIKVIATSNALKFVGTATLEGLSGNAVYTDTFEDGKMMAHIQLARWADLFILAPASLSQLSRLNFGLADNLLSTTYFALEKHIPKFIAPAMNTQMWQNEKTQQILADLKKSGVTILEPNSGQLACGENGAGRMQEPDQILANIWTPTTVRNILITSGGTKVPIDSVRYIGNYSTGRTGAVIADSFANLGSAVTLLHSESAILPENKNISAHKYNTYLDLEALLKKQLQEQSFDLVIHAAAVSDFSLEQTFQDKIESKDGLTLKLVPNEKLISNFKIWSKNIGAIVGFKLKNRGSYSEHLKDIQKVLFDCDYVVYNNMESIQSGEHRFSLHGKSGVIADSLDVLQLAEKLQKLQINIQPQQPEVNL